MANIKTACGIIALIGLLASCGLDEYYYLPQVPISDIHVELLNKATITLPNLDTSSSGYSYFYTFRIFYRIYISDDGQVPPVSPGDTNEMDKINASLKINYNTFSSYADPTNTTITTSGLGSVFKTQKYYELELGEHDINSVLSAPSSLGKTVVIDFYERPSERPSLEINGQTYTLFRSNGEGVFYPQPNRFFLNSEEICNSANATNPDYNADVADNTSISTVPNSERFTYVSMYIVATGIHPGNMTTIFSKPTWIGIFFLPPGGAAEL
jgi:hypothetical protein